MIDECFKGEKIIYRLEEQTRGSDDSLSWEEIEE